MEELHLVKREWSMKNELLVPPAAESDPNAIEVVRVWVAKGGQHVSINPLVWKDPQAWGIVLADLAGHVANAYEQALGLDREQIMKKSQTCFWQNLPPRRTRHAERCRIHTLHIVESEEY
jgi:hypothetical protein